MSAYYQIHLCFFLYFLTLLTILNFTLNSSIQVMLVFTISSSFEGSAEILPIASLTKYERFSADFFTLFPLSFSEINPIYWTFPNFQILFCILSYFFKFLKRKFYKFYSYVFDICYKYRNKPLENHRTVQTAEEEGKRLTVGREEEKRRFFYNTFKIGINSSNSKTCYRTSFNIKISTSERRFLGMYGDLHFILIPYDEQGMLV